MLFTGGDSSGGPTIFSPITSGSTAAAAATTTGVVVGCSASSSSWAPPVQKLGTNSIAFTFNVENFALISSCAIPFCLSRFASMVLHSIKTEESEKRPQPIGGN